MLEQTLSGRSAYLKGKMVGKYEVTNVSLGQVSNITSWASQFVAKIRLNIATPYIKGICGFTQTKGLINYVWCNCIAEKVL